jgi:hypothetical protein
VVGFFLCPVLVKNRETSFAIVCHPGSGLGGNRCRILKRCETGCSNLSGSLGRLPPADTKTMRKTRTNWVGRVFPLRKPRKRVTTSVDAESIVSFLLARSSAISIYGIVS